MARNGVPTGWYWRTTECPDCTNIIVQYGHGTVHMNGYIPPTTEWGLVYPRGSSRGPVPSDVPSHITADYIEAANVLPLSAKASAAISRRCLQNVLHAHGYRDRDLFREVEQLLNETDPRKIIPDSLRMVVDGIRHFGNFSAHPVSDVTSLQIIDVEPHEAEWCLDILDELFQHFYVRPAQALARKAALDAKLAAAGKPPSR
ncbi:DUF4145 domain-containing protein [Methylobacterium komagatae]